MDWSTPWKTLTNAVDSAQKAFDELEQTNTGEKLGPGAESRVERHREGKVGRQSEDFFQTNVTPIEKAETPSIRGEKFLETNAKKKQKDGDDWWLKDGHTVQTNKRKQKKDKITTAKRQLKISTPQNSNTSTAKTKDTGNNELPAATAPSPNHNNESPATAERKSPIAASDKAKSSKGNLQQQNEKLRRNLQKAIQAAKDARAQRQKLAQEVKEVKALNSDLQQKLEANTKEINKLKLTNGTLTSTNEALEAKLELMTKQLTDLEQTRSAAPIEGERHEAPHQLAIEPTNRLDVMNDDGTKGTLLNDSTALSIKATKQHGASGWKQ